jgi:hypothetical protein
MFEKLKYKIAEKSVVKNCRKLKDTETDFNKFFTNSNKILMIIPTLQEDADKIDEVYQFLTEKKKSVKLLRIASVKISMLNTTEIINLKEHDYNWLNLPKKEFLDQFRSELFDITIDLETKDNLISGYLTKQSNSNYKVGFKKEKSDLYYNFQISNSSINSEISYRNLLNSLLMF